jgi:hypothetical protein
LFNDLEHVYNMRSLVRLWVEYVINKYTLKALKDIYIYIFTKNNFVHTPHVINTGLTLINTINYYISQIHLVVPLIKLEKFFYIAYF